MVTGKSRVGAKQPVSNKALVIRRATLIDGTGRPPLADAVIVIEGERIKSIGKNGEISTPQGSRVIDAKGMTALPGFIDGHGHCEIEGQ